MINKNISEQEIIDTVKDAFNLGWLVIKLYFMIGLPTETDEDIADRREDPHHVAEGGHHGISAFFVPFVKGFRCCADGERP